MGNNQGAEKGFVRRAFGRIRSLKVGDVAAALTILAISLSAAISWAKTTQRVSALEDSMDRVNQKVDDGFREMRQQFDRVNQRIDHTNERFDQMDEKLNQLIRAIGGGVAAEIASTGEEDGIAQEGGTRGNGAPDRGGSQVAQSVDQESAGPSGCDPDAASPSHTASFHDRLKSDVCTRILTHNLLWAIHDRVRPPSHRLSEYRMAAF